jgi:putative spermidine/putrescine transport system substrate-binding protein
MRFLTKVVLACSAVLMAMTPVWMGSMPAQAQKSCDEFQVFMSISPGHRENAMAYIAPKLKEKYGARLVAEALGSAVIIKRVSAQINSPRVSIAQWDVPVGLQACAQGMCDPIDVSKAPNVKNLFEWGVTKNDAGKPIVLATSAVGVGLIYRTDFFKKNNLKPPTSWADLMRKDLKGRVSITHPTSTWGTAALVWHAKRNGGSESNIDPGFKKTMEILPNLNKVHLWSSELSNLLQLGEVWLGTTGSNVGPALQKKGLPVKWIVPKEGSPAVGGGLSLVKGGPCRDVAHTYLQHYYSDEFQAMRMRDGGIASASKTAWKAISPELRKSLPINPDSFDKLITLDWAEINKHRQGWIKRWQREVR